MRGPFVRDPGGRPKERGSGRPPLREGGVSKLWWPATSSRVTGGLKKLLPVPSKWNLKDKFIFEMVYNPMETKFIQKGRKEGATVVTGIDMLINQAAHSFKIWFDILPDTNEIKKIILETVKRS